MKFPVLFEQKHFHTRTVNNKTRGRSKIGVKTSLSKLKFWGKFLNHNSLHDCVAQQRVQDEIVACQQAGQITLSLVDATSRCRWLLSKIVNVQLK